VLTPSEYELEFVKYGLRGIEQVHKDLRGSGNGGDLRQNLLS
jgi:hypothetical protein